MDSQPIVALGGPDDKNPCIFPSYQGIWLQASSLKTASSTGESANSWSLSRRMVALRPARRGGTGRPRRGWAAWATGAERSAAAPDHPAILADLDPELHRLPLGIPAGVLGERRLGNGAPQAILARDTKGRRRRTLGRTGETIKPDRVRPRSPTRSSSKAARTYAPARRHCAHVAAPRPRTTADEDLAGWLDLEWTIDTIDGKSDRDGRISPRVEGSRLYRGP